MNKNLKKVISAVAALALSASSFVALAANYPDVDASASYKQAVDELSALKVIEGYEDGTYQPDKLVNRAEFSKMIITALGSAELSQAKAAEGRDTNFTDVKGEHWAAGYITAAVNSSIINGMGDGTFAPDANITYAQAMKMLVCAAGYEQWSVDRGGWPDGYMYWGNQLKIGNGVKDVIDSTEITRAQCAQMIDNVLTAPVCVNTQEYSYDSFGNKYPKLEAKDGYGEGYQSILIKNHDAYKVKGTVTETNKSSAGSVKADEVKFTIQNARNWLDQEEQISKSKGNSENVTLQVGDSDIANYLKQYVEAIVQETDDDEYVALSVVLAGQSDEVELDADDFDWENSNYKGTDYVSVGRLYFYNNSSSKTTNYKISEDVELYVNGVKYDDVNAGIDAFVKDNETSKVTLIDTPSEDNNTTDGYYDLILVDAYATMVIDTVDDVDTDEPTINGLGDDIGIGSWELDLDTEDITYNFTKDGAEVSVADLKQYDVLSIKYNVNDDFENSNFYDVIVSDAQETGSMKTYDPSDDEYDINGTKYGYISDLVGDKPLESSTTYTLYLDAFGRIAWLDEDTVSKKIAIIDSVYDVRGGEAYEAKLIFADGTSDTYVLKDSTDNITKAQNIVYDANGKKNDVQNRVINYLINGSSELTVKESYAPTAVGGTTNEGEYKSNTEKLGNAKVSLDTTSFINASDLSDIKAMSSSTLVDGTEYKAYAFDKSRTDSVYRFVIILSGAGDYTATTRMAVYNKTLNQENESGDQVDAYDLFVNGEQTTVNWESGLTATALTQGDAILYQTNASGEITGVQKLFSLDMTDTDTIWDAALNDSAAMIKDAKTFVQNLSTGKYDADLQFGVIVNKSTNSMTLATAEDSITDENTNAIDISYDSDCKYYEIDYNKNSKSRISANTSASAVTKASVVSAADMLGDKTQVDWSKNTQKPRLALVKTLDKDATDVYVIIPKKD